MSLTMSANPHPESPLVTSLINLTLHPDMLALSLGIVPQDNDETMTQLLESIPPAEKPKFIYMVEGLTRGIDQTETERTFLKIISPNYFDIFKTN